MNNNISHKDRAYAKWTINKVAEVLCDEWKDLNPKLDKDIFVYEKKVTQISFKGEVNVALMLMKQRFPRNVLYVKPKSHTK